MTLSDGFPPFYAARPTAVFYDIKLAYLSYTAIALFLGVLLVLPGVRGKDRKYFILRWVLSLFVGTSIIACIFGLSWHESVISTYLPNRAQGNKLARFEIGLHVGLRSFNVTFEEVESSANKSRADYNEEFYFRQTDSELTKGLKRGLPSPILDVVEFFTNGRVTAMWLWGRRYWIAGHFAVYMLWSAFAAWVLGNVLLSTFVKYGGLSRILTGILMIGANVSFASVTTYCCNLEIRLGYRDEEVLRPAYGWSFWLCLFVGIISIINGAVITTSYYMCSGWIHAVLNLEIIDEELLEVEYDKTPESSRRSSSSHHVQEEAHQSPQGRRSISSSGEELSRRGSPKKMELISMDSMPILDGPEKSASVQEKDEPITTDDEPTTSRAVKSTDL